MIIHYSILAYTIIIAGFGQAMKKNNMRMRREEGFYDQKSISLFYAILTFALVVFFAGMRSDFIDTYSYIDNFKRASTDVSFGNLKTIYENESSGVGFVYLEMFFKHFISSEYNYWFTFLAIFQAGAFLSLAYKYSANFTLSAFLYITSSEYAWMMNGIRQYTAVCLIIYFFGLVEKRRLFSFLIVVLLAYTIHSTAVFWIPIYFIVKFRPFSWRIWVCVVLTLVVVFFIDNFTSLLDSSLEDTQYAGTGDTLMNYGAADGIVDDGVNPLRVLVSAVAPGIALWRWNHIKDKTTPVIDIMINMATASTGVYLLAMVTSGILVGRVPAYFMMTNYVLLPWLLENAFEGGLKKLIKSACYFFYFAYFYYVMAINGWGYYVSKTLGIYMY